MNNEILYNSPNVANAIRDMSKIRKIPLKDILTDCKLGSNTISHMLHGKSIAFDSLAKIADCLNCSVDYLLGRSDNPSSHKQVCAIATDEREQELLDIFRQLNENGQENIRNFANYTFDDDRYKKFEDLPKQA